MAITRREFLKYSAVTGAGLLLGIFDLKPIVAYAQANPPSWLNEATSVCGYCSVGCSMIVGSDTIGGDPYVTYVQGNPDAPINKGSLCSKGMASVQFSTVIDPTTGETIPTPGRLTYAKKRVGGTTAWTSIALATAISEIALKVKATRDSYFVETEASRTVNRCPSIATLGGSSLSNESAYLISKLNRALGVVYLETQARN